MVNQPIVAITEDTVRDLLAHLYDNAYLRQHPLLDALVRRHMPDPLARTQHLRNVVIEAINSLRPPSAVPARSREWRPYGILVYRYLDGMTDEQIRRQLAISERQFYRDIKAGVALLTAVLQAHVAPEAEEEQDVLTSTLEGVGLRLERLDLSQLWHQVAPLIDSLCRELGKRVSSGPEPGQFIAIADAALSRQALITAASHALRHSQGDVELELVTAAQTEALFLRYKETAPQAKEAEPEALALARRLLVQQGGFLQIGGDQPTRLIGLHWRRFEEPPILLVDDSLGMLRLFTRYLAGHGYRVVTATDGEEAVRLARAHEVRLVVLDVMMRDTDGWTVLQRLKAEPRTHDTPVLVCSVIDEPLLARTLGAAGLLKKPVSREQLLDAVAAVIGI